MSIGSSEDGVRPGWEVIGAGKERTAYLSPRGVVYKAGSHEACATERDRFAEMLRGGLAEHVPPHEFYCFTMVFARVGNSPWV